MRSEAAVKLMDDFRQHMIEVGKREAAFSLVANHGGILDRPVLDHLLDFDAMKEQLQPFCSLPYGATTRRLAKLSILFMQTPHYRKAVELGWNEVDLWGVSRRDYRDAKPRGLLPTLAWSLMQGRKIRGIDREGCKLAVLRPDGTVSTLQMWRPHPCPGTVPFWQSEGLEVVA